MRTLLLLLTLCWLAPAQAEMVTDSTAWVTTSVDSAALGVEGCAHQWVYGDTLYPTSVCAVYHAPGDHCEFDNLHRSAICRLCLRREYQTEFWFQHFAETEKAPSEFDRLKDRLGQRGSYFWKVEDAPLHINQVLNKINVTEDNTLRLYSDDAPLQLSIPAPEHSALLTINNTAAPQPILEISPAGEVYLRGILVGQDSTLITALGRRGDDPR